MLLDIADAVAVRAALGANVTEAEVSDDMVMLDIYAGVASDRVLEWRDALTDEAHVPNDDPRLRRAATFLAAAFIATNVPHLLSERTPDYAYTAQALPAEMLSGKQDSLFAEAYTAVARAVGIGADMQPSPSVFDVASGVRGWWGPNTIISETQVPGRLFW
jgi:hypothetical protein